MPIRKDKVSFKYDVTKHLKSVPNEDREDAANDAGEAALEKISEFMEKQRSPVKGQFSYPKLSKEYADFKQSKVGNKKPNLRLNGELLESLDVEADDDSFTISVTGSDENIKKAYNHNVGDTLPKRQFIPNDNQTFKGEVVKAIKDAIKKYKKPKAQRPSEAEAPPLTVEANFANLLRKFKATDREKQIAKNVKSFKIEDIL